ncbi:hypothetical protein, partial [Mesorhizobium sp. M7A.F.Ca.CA.001.08.1.1]|uniref:hypothetical protein n=1 Tax=Mesorhizobium sp. M7A.F.Ca.CA.001.08.1.1 TaxID=2496691 RepID=UPI0019D1C850
NVIGAPLRPSQCCAKAKMAGNGCVMCAMSGVAAGPPIPAEIAISYRPMRGGMRMHPQVAENISQNFRPEGRK